MNNSEELFNELNKIKEELAKQKKKSNRYKDLLNRSIKNEKRREQQNEILQQDLLDKERRINILNEELDNYKNFSSQKDIRINNLQEEILDLEKKIQSGASTEETKKKNKIINEMLQKSNQLYADLQSKYLKVCEDLELEKEKKRQIKSIEKIIILNNEDSIILNSDSTYLIQPTKEILLLNFEKIDLRKNEINNEKKNKQTEDINLFKNYLKCLFLEFFIGDSSTQNRLIPVILSLLGSSQEQIVAAQRSFAEGKQIITRATAAFNFL